MNLLTEHKDPDEVIQLSQVDNLGNRQPAHEGREVYAFSINGVTHPSQVLVTWIQPLADSTQVHYRLYMGQMMLGFRAFEVNNRNNHSLFLQTVKAVLWNLYYVRHRPLMAEPKEETK